MRASGGLVGVHIGAGSHSATRTDDYLAVCADACRKAVAVLNDGREHANAAVEAAVAATCVLEDSPETNAGYGSNLTEDGRVEMDASVMEGSSLLFGSVGAAPELPNPVLVAARLLEEQRHGLLPLGRVPPATLVGRGATLWASKREFPVVEKDSSLISPKAEKLYAYYKHKLDALNPVASSSSFVLPEKRPKMDEMDDGVKDTVGVVVVDHRGNVASTVSSGGIVLKQFGRVGQAAMFGCGCWAQCLEEERAVAVSTTGCGEHLVRTFLAKELAEALTSSSNLCMVDQGDRQGLSSSRDSKSVLRSAMEHKFMQSPFLSNVDEKLGGAICLQVDKSEGQLLWTHTTPSMGLAFQACNQDAPTTIMSRMKKSSVMSENLFVILVAFGQCKF